MISYTNFFYKSVSSRSEEVSNKVLTHLFKSAIQIKSIKDVGCGEGEWFNSKVLNEGKYDLFAYDLPEAIALAKSKSKIDIKFHPINLEFIEINIFADTDVTIFTEVAEHLTEECAKKIINFICDTSKIVIFSGAIPGQGGYNHINEQPLKYWIQLFEVNNFIPVDFLRPIIREEKSVPFYYRNNLFLFIKNSDEVKYNHFKNFDEFDKQIVRSDQYIIDYRNFLQKLRYKIIEFFSYKFVNIIYRLVDFFRFQ